MHTTEEVLQLLQSSDEKLTEILDACGWTGTTEFTDEQVETLIAIQAIQEENNDCSYLSAFFQTIAHKHEMSNAQINEVYSAIRSVGSSLIDYRDRFEFICTKVHEGADPKDVLTATEKGQQTVDDMAADYIQHLKDSGDFKKAAIRALDSIPEIVSQRQIGVVAAGLQEFDETIRRILSDPESEYRQKMNAVINGEVINAELGKRSLNPTSRASLKPASSSSTNSTST